MSTFTQVEFSTPKENDRKVLDSLVSISEECGYTPQGIVVEFDGGGSGHNISPEKFFDLSAIEYVLQADSYILRQFKLQFSSNQAVTIVRQPDQAFDKVTVHPASENERQKFLALVASAKKRLRALNPKIAVTKQLGEAVDQFLQAREANIEKLENISESIVRNAEDYRKKTEIWALEKEKEFSERYNQDKISLEESFSVKESNLRQRELTLENRLKEIDDRNSKHARREIHRKIKEKLEQRNAEFTLTKGTRRLRLWTGSIALVLLGAFGWVEYHFVQQLTSTAPTTWQEWLFFLIRYVAPALAFGATAVYLLRWTNDYFERHAREEFRLKRLDLDIDRATFLVETALEWKDEKENEIPDFLLERLSANLFIEDGGQDTTLHPYEELLSGMKNASGDLEIKVPLGRGRFGFGRKNST